MEGFLREKVQAPNGTTTWDERFFSLDLDHRRLIVSMAVEDGSTKVDKIPVSDISLVNLWGGEGNDENFDILLANGVLRSLRGESATESRQWCKAIEKMIEIGDSAPSAETSHQSQAAPTLSTVARVKPLPVQSTINTATVTSEAADIDQERLLQPATTFGNGVFDRISSISEDIKHLTEKTKQSVAAAEARSKSVGEPASSVSLNPIGPNTSVTLPHNVATHVDVSANNSCGESLVELLNASLHDMEVATRKAEIRAERYVDDDSETASDSEATLSGAEGNGDSFNGGRNAYSREKSMEERNRHHIQNHQEDYEEPQRTSSHPRPPRPARTRHANKLPPPAATGRSGRRSKGRRHSNRTASASEWSESSIPASSGTDDHVVSVHTSFRPNNSGSQSNSAYSAPRHRAKRNRRPRQSRLRGVSHSDSHHQVSNNDRQSEQIPAAQQFQSHDISFDTTDRVVVAQKIDWLRQQLQQKAQQVSQLYEKVNALEETLRKERENHNRINSENLADLQSLQKMHAQQISQMQLQLQAQNEATQKVQRELDHKQDTYQQQMAKYEAQIEKLNSEKTNFRTTLEAEKAKVC